MKPAIILLIIAMIAIAAFFLTCNNESSQKKAYQDTANMWADSLEKYKALPEPDSNDFVRQQRFFLAKTMWEYYTDKAE